MDPAMLRGLEVLQVFRDDAAEPAARAVRFAAGLAAANGAHLFRQGQPTAPDGPFHHREDEPVNTDPLAWTTLTASPRIALIAAAPGAAAPAEIPAGASAVFVELESWHSEATLFAASGIADLIGHPDEAPIVPAANYAAHSIGYAAYAAVTALYANLARFGHTDCAVLNSLAVLGWINWKAGALGALGREIRREGPAAEWPIAACRDGHVACLYTERDWPALVEMIGDERLKDDRFNTFEGRQKYRDDYMGAIRRWCEARDKAEIKTAFEAYAIPGGPVSTIADTVEDPLFAHRRTLRPVPDGAILPVPPERIAATSTAAAATQEVEPDTGDLPLSGIRVLDLGIITAGAGVSAILADLGAEVIKVESHSYPDPFRKWAGSDDSPLFRFNNRNKYGIDLDLKTEAGKAAFFELASSADIVVENFRRGVLDRLGLTFEALSAVNPSILLAAISGLGLDGPGSGVASFGSTQEASAGFAALSRDQRGLPYVTGRALNYPDQIVCLYGAATIAAAVTECRRSGIGRHIDIAQRDCVLYQIGDVLAHVAGGGSERAAEIRHAIFDRDFDGIYACADGAYIALTAPRDADLSLVDSWTGDPAAWAAGRGSDAAIAAFRAAGFGAAKAVVGSEMIEDPVIKDAGVFADGLNDGMVKGFPFQFLRKPMTIHLDAPRIGEHNDMFLRKEGEVA